MKKPTLKTRSSRRASKDSVRRTERQSASPAEHAAELQDILITSKLQSRRRRPNSEAENIALRTLARVMAEKPGELVDSLLNVALDLCEAGTAGLSVLDNREQVFRWTNVAGTLARHVGGTTPREFSPCGVTMDRKAPQLFLYPARRFQYFKRVEPAIAEALVLPIWLEGAMPATIWIVSHNPRVHFDSEDVRVMTALADFTASALRLSRSLDQEKRDRLASDKEVAAHEKTEHALYEVQNGLEADLRERSVQLQHLSASLVAHQDEERRRLARELHDSTGQYLAAIQMNLAMAQSGAHAPAREAKIAEARKMAELCLSEIRTISYLLHPPLLDELGLRSAISSYVEGFAERSAIQVELQIPETLRRLPGPVETALFRVVQQSLSNIHRHSGSASASVVVTLDALGVSVRICDQGRGISAKIIQAFNSGTALLGVGVAGMRERIRDMGGKFLVESSEKGTTVQASLPVS
jgi:signal transduction histidine kinase